MNKAEILANLRFMRSKDFPEIHGKEHQRGREDAYDHMIIQIDQLDEPEKVVVPQFVAEWIEECKKENVSAFLAYNRARIFNHPSKVWIMSNPDLFVRAWLDGYTVEEKKYTVALPGIEKNGYQAYLFKNVGKKISLADNNIFGEMQFTEKEINAIDPRYMAFAEEVDAE